MIKNRLLSVALLVLFCVIFWNAMDYIYTSLITQKGYSFSLFSDVCLPAVIGVTVGFITILRKGHSGQ